MRSSWFSKTPIVPQDGRIGQNDILVVQEETGFLHVKYVQQTLITFEIIIRTE